MLNLDTVDVPIEGENSALSLQEQAEFLKEITKPVLQASKSNAAPSTAKVLFEDAEPEGNGIAGPLDVLVGRARRGLSSAGFSAKERAAFIESMIASGNSRDRSKSDTGTYYSVQRKEDDEEEEEEEDRNQAANDLTASYFNEMNIKEVAVELENGDPSKKLPPYLRFAAGREKRSVSDAAYSPTVVVTQPAVRPAPPVGREKRSVSDASYLKWARKQSPLEDEEEFEDFEEEAIGEAILEPKKQGRVCKALAITDPQTHQPIDLSKMDLPGQPHSHAVHEEPQAMTWDEFRYKEEYGMQPPPPPPPPQPQHQHQHQMPQQFAQMPMAAYPTYSVPPAYTVPFAGQPMYPPAMYPTNQQLMYVHRTPERYRWEQSLQKFVKTMDASITYYPMAPTGIAAASMGLAMQPPMPPPPVPVPMPSPPKPNMVHAHSHQRGPVMHHQPHHHQPHQMHHHHPQNMHPVHMNHNQPRSQPREDMGKQDGGMRDNAPSKKKDSRDPYSFSAFLTAKNVTIPGDDSGSRAVMMQFLNEYLSQVTPSYPKRHVRNAQRQLKMLQRRAQQDNEASTGTNTAATSEIGDNDDGSDDPSAPLPASAMYSTGPFGVPSTFTPVALTV